MNTSVKDSLSNFKHKSGIKHKHKSLQLVCILIMLLFGISNMISAQNYPFVLPDTIHATLNVQTNVQEAFKNPILGYNIFGFRSATEKALINTFNPTTIRFPHGLFANWYDWRTDKTRVFGTETFYYIHRGSELKEVTIGELGPINTMDRLNMYVGIDGLEQLNNERKAANQGQGYDVVWTLNMSADGPDFTNGSPETVAFYESLIERGFDVKVVEMGNECFYPNQRSSIIPNATEYIARAKSMYTALKAKDPNIQLSIPLLRRGSFVNPTWNADLTKDMDYFDAITVHTYIGSDPDDAANSDEAYSTALTARKSLESSTNDFVRIYSGDKPIWLTEWGVKSGGPNAASVLGMADCYLFMAENQDIYHRANWFSVNGKLNSFLVWDGNNIKYPLKKTGYGSTHEILKAIFENSTLLESIVTTTNLVPGVKAVNARAVTKDGITTVFAINLSDKPAVFNLNIDGSPISQTFLHETMAYDHVGHQIVLGIDENPLSRVNDGQGDIVLPPLSLNKITLKAPVEYAVKFESPLNGAVMDMGTNLIVEASAGSAVTSVSLFINEILVRSISSAPYIWGEDTIVDVALKNLEPGFYNLKLEASNADTISFADAITIEIQDTLLLQRPFAGKIPIPGKFEAENYDLGGQGIAYHDSDTNNQGGVYRSDGVDIGTGGSGFVIAYTAVGEWLEYTIDVEEDGLYDIEIYYSSGRPGGGAKIGLSLPEENLVLITSFDLPVTANWATYQKINIGTVSLTKGVQILRITMVDRGFNLDWVEIKKYIELPNSVDRINHLQIKVYPNPSTGRFNIDMAQSAIYSVYNLSGVKLIEGKANGNFEINLSGFATGVYLLKMRNHEGIAVKRLLIE